MNATVWLGMAVLRYWLPNFLRSLLSEPACIRPDDRNWKCVALVTYGYVCVNLLVLIHLIVIKCCNFSLFYIMTGGSTSEAGHCATAVLFVDSPQQAQSLSAFVFTAMIFLFLFSFS